MSAARRAQDSPLSAEALAKIEKECAKYPANRRASAIMAALRIAQFEHGWLPKELIAHIAGVIGVPPIRAHEVATFYSMFDCKPVGRRKLCLCTNIPCALMGAADTGGELKKQLGIGYGETTPDGKWTLVEGECFGACNEAPVLIVDNVGLRGKVTADKVGEFLAGLDPGQPD